jgi:electron transfer flavoprotein alpha subunit
MAEILVYSDNLSFALELATVAAALKDIGDFCMLSVNDEELADALAAKGLNVCHIKSPAVHVADTAAMSMVLQSAVEELGVKTILLASNRRGKELSGRLAETLNAGCLTDIKTIHPENDNLVFTRNALNGATIATQLITTERKVAAVSPRSYPAWNESGEGSVQIMEIDATSTIEIVEIKAKSGDQVNIEEADRIIAVGQGVENKEDLTMIEMIAKKLKAEIACSKPVATDRKWFGEDRIIGLSGKICKPELAITMGVSGQVQFMVGIRESQILVSINNDENADINKNADYVLVADLNEILPALEVALT